MIFVKMVEMTVKTKFTKKELVKILSDYDLGGLKSFSSLAEGTVQTNYFIKTNRYRLIFRYYENRSKGSVAFESNLLQFLREKGYPCPEQFRNKNGEFIGEYNNKYYIVFEFIDGKHLKKPTRKQKMQLIKKVAELQILTSDWVPLYKEFRWNYDVEFCFNMACKIALDINTDSAREKLKWYKEELNNINIPNSLPKGVSHCDFYFSNVIFKDGKFKALIDFDDANYTYLTYDLATLIYPFIPKFNWNTWRKFSKADKIFDFQEARWVVQQYSKHRRLSPGEKESLFDMCKLSIMIDCLWYFKRGESNDFFERREIELLNNLGRKRFYNKLFV